MKPEWGMSEEEAAVGHCSGEQLYCLEPWDLWKWTRRKHLQENKVHVVNHMDSALSDALQLKTFQSRG
jgi:hypothetical protein